MIEYNVIYYIFWLLTSDFKSIMCEQKLLFGYKSFSVYISNYEN